jgi:hypothetical protein
MKIFLQTLLTCTLIAFWGCSNEFEVAAPWKDIPVTYSILSAKDSFQYVRVEKAFLSQTQGADEVARIPDSLYYPESAISVTLVKENGAKTYNLTRVDGNLEGLPRQTGIFADSPNWLYKAKTFGVDSLTPGAKYKVVIKKNDSTNKEVFGETTLPSKFYYIAPVTNQLLTKISFDTSGISTFEWRCDGNAVFFNLKMLVKIKETDPITGAILKRESLVWDIGKNIKRTDSQVSANIYKASTKSPSFYRFLNENLQPTGNYRYFEDFTLTLVGGGKEIDAFLESLSANSGITGAEVVPTYTNMSEGYGIVTSKNILEIKNVRIDIVSLQKLIDHPLVRNLNFKI